MAGLGWWVWLQHHVDQSMCLAPRLRVSRAVPLVPPNGLIFKEWQIYHYHQFCFQLCKKPDLWKYWCAPTILWLFHHWSKLLASHLTSWNLEFTFLRGTCTMNVKATEWKCIFKTYSCTVSDAPRRHHICSKRGDVFPRPAPNCEQMKHNIKKFSVFRITWLPPSSEPDTGYSTWRNNSIYHIPVILN